VSVVESAVGALHQHEFVSYTPRFQVVTWSDLRDIGGCSARNNGGEGDANFLLHKMSRVYAFVIADVRGNAGN
jgi:hypothetical protein